MRTKSRQSSLSWHRDNAWDVTLAGIFGDSFPLVRRPLKSSCDQDANSSPPITDIWWLVWGVFLVAAIERNSLLDEDKKWFDMFRVLFELVSAFGGIGLSLGFPSVSL